MRRTIAAVLGMLLWASALAGGGGKIAWGTDYAAGLKEARKEGKPLMLYFTATW